MTAAVAIAALLAIGVLARSQAPGAARRRLRGITTTGAPRRAPAPAWFVHALETGRWRVDHERAWSAARLGATAAAVLALASSLPLGLAVAGTLGAAPRALARLDESLRRRRCDVQLVEALELLAGDLRAGVGLRAALEALGERTPDPLGLELRALGSELRHGASLTEALDRWGRRPTASPEVRLAATALGLGAEAGGPLARSVDQVAATLRERRELRAEVRALAAQARASAGVLAVAPLAFTTAVAAADPAVRRFLATSPVGIGCLVAGLALEGIGAAWIARILGSAA